MPREGILGKEATRQRAEAGEGAALLLRMVNDFILWCAVDARTRDDALRIDDEVRALFKAGANGVLIARHMGQTPDSAGNTHATYLGLTVVGTGATEEEAISKLRERQRQHAARNTRTETTMCTPGNPTGKTFHANSATISALPEGYNWHYGGHVASQVMAFRERNPNNEKSDEGNPFQRAYTEADYIFSTYNEWRNFISLINIQRRPR